MDAMEELSELSESMRQAASLLADDDPSDDAAPRRPSTFLNAVTLGNVGAGKSAVLNSLIGHPVLPTGENGATRAPIVVDLQRDPGLSSKSIVLQIDRKSQQVSASAHKRRRGQLGPGGVARLASPSTMRSTQRSTSGVATRGTSRSTPLSTLPTRSEFSLLLASGVAHVTIKTQRSRIGEESERGEAAMAGGDRERDVEEETRNQMMQNLFGDQSEDEDEEDDEAVEVVDEDDHPHQQQQRLHEADDEEEDDEEDDGHGRSGYHSEEGEGEAENGGEGDAEGEGESEGQVGMEEESEAEAHHAVLDQVESDGEKVQSSPERELSDRMMQTDARGMDSEDEAYEQRAVVSRKRGVVASESEGSEDNYYADQAHEDEETRKPSLPMEEERDHEVVRDVFGDSDEDEPAPYHAQHEIDEDSHRSPMEDEGHYEKDLHPDDVVADEDMRYESDENRELKPKEKPVGPPLNLVVPLKQPPAQPDRMNVIKVSNIMGIDPRPFDPKTYVEEDVFLTDESGTKKRIRLEDNIVRWRTVKNADGTTSCESNARFVKWKDGSMQLLIGNEVLDISVHEANHDQSHLYLRNGKGVLQSQGRLLRKMRFMPSSLSSKSHRLLTALVDSQNKKTVKMRKWFDAKDPERAKQEKERAEGQNIRAHSILQRKREKVNRKYTQPVRPRRQLSPGFLEDALDEDEEPDNHYNSRRMPSRSRFEDELEAEALAERRIINAKKSNMSRSVPRKPSFPPRPPRHQANEYTESEREESEYETEGEDIEHSPTNGREDELDEEDEYEEDVEEEVAMSDEEIEEPKRRRESGGAGQRRKEIDSDDEDSPPRKQQAVHRRKAVVFDSDDE